MSKPRNWDERDYLLWSEISVLPSYGLVAGDRSNPMVALKDIVRCMEKLAAHREAPTPADQPNKKP